MTLRILARNWVSAGQKQFSRPHFGVFPEGYRGKKKAVLGSETPLLAKNPSGHFPAEACPAGQFQKLFLYVSGILYFLCQRDELRRQLGNLLAATPVPLDIKLKKWGLRKRRYIAHSIEQEILRQTVYRSHFCRTVSCQSPEVPRTATGPKPHDIYNCNKLLRFESRCLSEKLSVG